MYYISADTIIYRFYVFLKKRAPPASWKWLDSVRLFALFACVKPWS